MKIIILPPQKSPKLLTAYARSLNLAEHKLAFLNANNKSGFEKDELPEVIKVEKPKSWDKPANIPNIQTELDFTFPDRYFRKHILSTRFVTSSRICIFEKTPLCVDEYLARRKLIQEEIDTEVIESLNQPELF
jgi:hypothetical protein